MTKRQVIDNILEVNASADPGFLSQFERDDLTDYLRKLNTLAAPRLTGGAKIAARACEPTATLNDFLADVEPAFPVSADAVPCPATRPGWRNEQYETEQPELDIPAGSPPDEIPTAEPEPVPVGVYAVDQADEPSTAGKLVPAAAAATDDADQMVWLF